MSLTSRWRAREAGARTGDGPWVIEINRFVGEAYGAGKNGAAYAYTRVLGCHPIIATRADTGEVLHIC
jgi:hypothetical protein